MSSIHHRIFLEHDTFNTVTAVNEYCLYRGKEIDGKTEKKITNFHLYQDTNYGKVKKI